VFRGTWLLVSAFFIQSQKSCVWLQPSLEAQVQRLVNELRLCKTPHTPLRFVTVSPQGARRPGILLATVKLIPSLCWTRVLRVVSLGGPQKGPGEGGGISAQRGVFGNGVTYAARGPVNRETGALGGFSLRAESHRESLMVGPLAPCLMLSASGPGVVIRLTAPGWQRSSRFSRIVGEPHLGSRLTPQRVVRLSGSRGWCSAGP
jgi:hypothetical protein